LPNGQVSWSPTLGNTAVALLVSDGRGGTAEQDYTITTIPWISFNQILHFPPYFTSTPVVDANVTVPYSYQATAFEPALPAMWSLTFSELSGPAGLSCTTGGLVSWTPTAAQLGANAVTLQVSDSNGGTATQSYSIFVRQVPGNHPPMIVSTPITSTVVNNPYQYPVLAIDADHDPLTYSLLINPTGMTIGPKSGLIDWTPTSVTTGAGVEVKVQVSDGRGGFDTQDYFLQVTSLNEIHGRKFADINGSGNPGGVTIGPVPWSVPPINLTAIPTTFDGMMGVDYHEPTNTLVVSVNNGTGLPLDYERIKVDGTHVPFSNASGFTDEEVIYSVRSGSAAGWTVGDLFSGNGQGGQIVKLGNGGNAVLNPWIILPGETGASVVHGLTIDRTGIFGGNMIATTSGGGVWSVTPQGQATRLANVGTQIEGAAIVPDDPARYGPLAGTIVSMAENTNGLYAVSPSGTATFYSLPAINSPEDVKVIPANQTFFGMSYSTSQMLAAPASYFMPMTGDLLINSENHPTGSGLFDLHWNGTSLVTTQISLATGSATPGNWEHFTFAPDGLGSISGTDQTGPSLPDWPINLKNSSGVVIASTLTDQNGNYAFTSLANGTYTVAEVQDAVKDTP
jgi:hypothetical protein